MNQGIVDELRTILGEKRVTADPVETATYAYDASGESFAPEVVVWPETEEEVSAIMKVAYREEIPVTPRGMGSGRVGGSVPTGGGIAMSLERMNRIIEVDPANRQALVEPGVNTGKFKKAMLERGLFYPPDPASSEYCTIGGNIATSAGGLACLKYGTTKDYVQQLRVVLADGKVITVGSKAQKSVTGYEMVNLFIGSEGTLGIITRVLVKLLPAPQRHTTLLAEFGSSQDAARATAKMVVEPILPSSLEFADRETIVCARKYAHADVSEDCQALLLVQVDTLSAGEDIKRFARICQDEGATLIRQSEDPEEQEALWDVRRSFSPATFKAARHKVSEDVSVPAASIPELLERLAEIARKRRMKILSYGHAGDGNVHVNVLTDLDDDPDIEPTLEDLFRNVIELGGTLSGEHGVGITKAPFIRLEIGERELELMRQIKRVFDPMGILNPGKIFGIHDPGPSEDPRKPAEAIPE